MAAASTNMKIFGIVRLLIYAWTLILPIIISNRRSMLKLSIDKKSIFAFARLVRLRHVNRQRFFRDVLRVVKFYIESIYGPAGSYKRNVVASFLLSVIWLSLSAWLTVSSRMPMLRTAQRQLVAIENDIQSSMPKYHSQELRDAYAWKLKCGRDIESTFCISVFVNYDSKSQAIREYVASLYEELTRRISQQYNKEDLSVVLLWQGTRIAYQIGKDPAFGLRSGYPAIVLVATLNVFSDLLGILFVVVVIKKLLDGHDISMRNVAKASLLSVFVAIVLFVMVLVPHETALSGQANGYFVYAFLLPAIAFLFWIPIYVNSGRFRSHEVSVDKFTRVVAVPFFSMYIIAAISVGLHYFHRPTLPRLFVFNGINYFAYVLALGALFPVIIFISGILTGICARYLPQMMLRPAYWVFKYIVTNDKPVLVMSILLSGCIELIWRLIDLK